MLKRTGKMTKKTITVVVEPYDTSYSPEENLFQALVWDRKNSKYDWFKKKDSSAKVKRVI